MSLVIFILIGVAVFIFWHFVPEKQKEPPKPAPRYRKDARVSASETEWQRYAEGHCESPAEVAFLRAMITSLGMRPHLGALVSEGVRLDFQVEDGRYRVDFLVNHWLVVEIDGAAYHSSPEAQLRDRVRDRYFESLGYSVLRIPAKLVFQEPRQAVKKVQSAISVGKRVTAPPAPVSKGGLERLRDTANALERASEAAEKRELVRKTISKLEEALSAEENALNNALRMANVTLELREYIANASASSRAAFLESGRILGVAPEENPINSIPPMPRYIKFTRPILTGDDWVDGRISDLFGRIETRREIIFADIINQINEKPNVRPLVKNALEAMGRNDIWERLT